jgi:hypothetical protein
MGLFAGEIITLAAQTKHPLYNALMAKVTSLVAPCRRTGSGTYQAPGGETFRD